MLYMGFHQQYEETQGLFADKTKSQRKDTPAAEFYERAGIWAEFGKIICLSVGSSVCLLQQEACPVATSDMSSVGMADMSPVPMGDIMAKDG